MRYRKRPAEIDAMLVPREAKRIAEVVDWMSGYGFRDFRTIDNGVAIKTADGERLAGPGDWVVRDELGAFCVCSPCVFESRYEVVI